MLPPIFLEWNETFLCKGRIVYSSLKRRPTPSASETRVVNARSVSARHVWAISSLGSRTYSIIIVRITSILKTCAYSV